MSTHAPLKTHCPARLCDGAVSQLCAECPSLQRLVLHGCTSLATPQITGPALEVLQLGMCEALEPSALVHVMHECPKLAKLDITGCELLLEDSHAIADAISSAPLLVRAQLEQAFGPQRCAEPQTL